MDPEEWYSRQTAQPLKKHDIVNCQIACKQLNMFTLGQTCTLCYMVCTQTVCQTCHTVPHHDETQHAVELGISGQTVALHNHATKRKHDVYKFTQPHTVRFISACIQPIQVNISNFCDTIKSNRVALHNTGHQKTKMYMHNDTRMRISNNDHRLKQGQTKDRYII